MKTIKLEYWSKNPDNYTGIIEYPNGTKYWFLNGKRHRIDGPAIETITGAKYWYLNGEYHREDGPAIEWSNRTKSWYLNGESYSEDEYKTEMMIRNSSVGKLLMKRTQL